MEDDWSALRALVEIARCTVASVVVDLQGQAGALRHVDVCAEAIPSAPHGPGRREIVQAASPHRDEHGSPGAPRRRPGPRSRGT